MFKTARGGSETLAPMNVRLPALIATLLLQACMQAAPPYPSPAAALAATASMRCLPQTISRLHFGFDTPSGPVSEPAWQRFVSDEITPRLPAGFTMLAARGQWRAADGRIHSEDSRVLEVVGDNDEALRLTLAEIVGRYKLGFAQESVLLTQSEARVCS
jgi:Protein of unknown function (DUF3574)